MFAISKPLGLSALFIFISAILHLLAPLLAGSAGNSFILIPIGIVYAAMAYLLLGNRRWLAWLAFFVMLAGGIAAMVSAVGAIGLPGLWWGLIMAADWIAAAMLFVYLWLPKPA